MQCNLNKADRSIRLIVGVALLGAALYFKSGWGWLAALAGLALIFNAAVGVCWGYRIFGISTYKKGAR